MNNKNRVFAYLLLAACTLSCAEEFLDVRRDKTQVIPHSLNDYQALLDNVSIFNLYSCYQMNVVGSDEYVVEDNVWDLLPSTMQKNAYIWAEDAFGGAESESWNYGYERILYTNTVLEGIKNIDKGDVGTERANNIEGSALFMRGYTYYQLAQTFAPQYDASSSHSQLGLPLRLEMDITMPVERASLEDTYQRIIIDLHQAIPLLPLRSDSKFRPIRPAAYALMAKIYMHKGDYKTALSYADSCLVISNELIDFNTLDLTLRYTFSEFQYGENNPEVLYMELIPGQTIVNSSRFCIATDLYDSYEDSDIRKEAFFFPTRGTYSFKGSYTGAYGFFGGLALDEVVLIRAECHARLGNNEYALDDLNYFLSNRYKVDAFVPFAAQHIDDIIPRIIAERRKQLLCRGTRWEDLRRFNKEDKFSTVLTRELKGETHTLQPNDVRYTWPIPDNVIKLSGIRQNPR